MNSKVVDGGHGNTIISKIVWVDGFLDQDKFQFVLDSCIALSVLHYEIVNPTYHQCIQKEWASAVVGANGLLLDVIG